MIVINFKTYPQATGRKALTLAKICQKVQAETGVEIIIGLQTADIYRVASRVKVSVFGQHADPVEPGRNNGMTTAMALKKAGASGVFLNHSEYPFKKFDDLVKAVNLANKERLKTLIFVKDLKTALEVDRLNPDIIGLEEPSLVSGDKAMVKDEKLKKEIKKFAESIKAFPLVGAGIREKEDVSESLKLGVKGVGLASGFVKASNPEAFLRDLVEGF